MKTLVLLAIATLFSGCVVTTKYHNEETKTDGTKVVIDASYSSPAFGAKLIQSADFKAGKISGVSSDQSSVAEVIAQAVSAGVLIGQKSVKP